MAFINEKFYDVTASLHERLYLFINPGQGFVSHQFDPV